MGSDNGDIYPSKTRWSMVMRAGSPDPNQGQRAFGELFSLYRHPIYCSVRKCGWDHHEAEDLVQAYFVNLMGRDYLRQADPAKGKFRAFIQKDLKFFLSNEIKKANALKRGGKVIHVPVDEGDRPGKVPDPEDLPPHFDREWALATLASAMDKLKASYKKAGSLEVFENLQPLLDKDIEPGAYEVIGQALGMKPSTVKVAMHRLRERLGLTLEGIVRDTLVDPTPEEIRDEIRYLFSKLAA